MERSRDFFPLNKKQSSRATSESKLERSKSLQALDNLDLDLEIPENDFNIEDFIKIDCTYLKYGSEPQNQQGYTCSQCNPTKNLIICEACYKICHQNCLKTPQDLVTSDEGTLKPFSCFCGEKMKHWNIQKKIEQNIKKCTMSDFDRKIGSTKQFYCQTHKIVLCSICSKECHANCPDVIARETNEIKDCQCSDNNHSEYNEFTFVIAKSKTNEDYENNMEKGGHEIARLWPIQILNLLFETEGTFNQLIPFVQSIINTGSEGTLAKFENPFPRIIGLFSDTFDRKFKTAYYHPSIIQLFRYEKLCPFLKNIVTQTPSQKLLKFRLIFILLFIHLKYDFQLIKSLTSIDFVCSPILERLLYKKFIFTRSIYTKNIHSKYKINSDSKDDIYNIKYLVLNELNQFMVNSIKSGLNLEIYHQEYEIALKCICFMLKHMLFNQKELGTLIEYLYDFYNKFDFLLENNLVTITSVEDIFNCIVEICVLIGVNYNDNVVYSYLTKSKVNTFDKSKLVDEFIHVKSEQNGMLFKIIVRGCRLIREHYKPQTTFQFTKKILFLFDQALKLFSIADNFYYEKLSEITEEDLTNFYERYKKIQNNKQLSSQALTAGILQDELKPVLSSTYLNPSSRGSETSRSNPIEENKKDSLFILKNNIEEHLKEYFTSSAKETKDTARTICTELENFARRISDKICFSPSSSTRISKANIISNRVNTQNEESIDQKRIKEYIVKLIKIIKRYFPFLAQKSFEDKVDQFVDELIFSNIDETVFKVLIFFSNRRYYNEIDVNVLNVIFSFLSMFFLTRKGLQYFLLGKNFTRMNKLFNRFRYKDKDSNVNPAINKTKENNILFTKKILEFIFLICKGITFHNLNLTGHKVLDRFTKNMINHLEIFKKDIKENLTTFKIHIMLIMNIFNLLEHMISEPNFEEIKFKILGLFDMPEINFFKNEKLIEIFIKEEKDDKGRIVSLEEETQRGGLLSLKENKSNIPTTKAENIELIDIHDIMNDFNLISEADESNQPYLNENLYQAFFDLVINRTYYVYNDNENTKKILPMNFITLDNLDKYKLIFVNKNFSLKIRHSLLNYFRTFFFIDFIDKGDITKMTIQLTTNEYIMMEEDKKNTMLKDKYNSLQKILKIIDIYTQELILFPEQMRGKSINEGSLYLKDLILSVKFIADFYYKEKNIWSKACLAFYKLTMQFLNKKETLVKTYNDIMIKGKPDENANYYVNNEGINELYAKMTKRSFDIINKNDIYDYLSIGMNEVFEQTNLNQSFNLQTFLSKFDSASDANFTPFSLIKEKDYEYFYEDEENDFDSLSPSGKKIETLKETFTKFHTDIDNTVFLDIISGISNEADQIDYRKEIFDYFVTYLLQCKDDEFVTHKTIGILCVVTKMLFYDTEATQENLKFILNTEYETFFKRLLEILKIQYVHLFTASRNIFIPSIFLSITNLTKLLLQFLQLLGEGFNKTFHNKILGDPDTDFFTQDTFYRGFVQNLVYASQFMSSEKLTNYEMPYDKLVVLTSNLVDIIVEYMEVIPDMSGIVNNGMSQLLRDGFFNKLFLKIDIDSDELTQNSKIICLIKGKILDLLIAFLQNGDKKNEIRQYLKLISPSALFEQILHHFQAISQIKQIHKELDNYYEKKFVNTLINLYVYNKDFCDDMNLQLCFKMFILIKIYEDLYQIVTLEHTMEKIKQMEIKRMPNLDIYGLNSKFAYKVRLFLEQLVLKVDIKRIKEDEEDECEIEVNYETFFIRPPLTYYLSEQTKRSFEENVDRTSTSAKIQNLLFFSDYFIFEMVANSRLLGPGSWSKFMQSIQFHNIELINYLILVIQNLIMLIYHYKGVDLSDEEYNEVDQDKLYDYITGNFVIAIIHLVFLIGMLAIWFNYKFPLYLEQWILKKNTTNFVFRKGSDGGKKKITQDLRDFFDDEVEGSRIIPVITELNKEVSLIKRIYNAIFDAILFNREICVLLYTVIFIVIYLATQCIIWLAIPLLFIMNLNETLFNVFISVKDHFGQLFGILMFTYLFAYNFMWISFHFMSNLHTLEEIFDEETQEEITEEFCTSSIPCLLNIIDYNVAYYAVITGKVSFKKDPGFFMINFFYDFLFFIIVSLIMINVFLGVLYDTFGELREILQQKENDIKNVCFICQLTRDGSLTKNIDFDKHVVTQHSMWNYVYFLIFLHISNPNNFNGHQNYVWDKLGEQDSSWIPHDKTSEEEEDEDDDE